MPRRVSRQRRRRAQQTSVTRERQRWIEQEERELLEHQENCFKGAAVVQLSDLLVPRNGNRLMEDEQNATRLEQVLRRQGCYRLTKAVHAPVVIDATDWTDGRAWFQSQESAGLGPNLTLPQLCKEPDFTLLALDQESLIAAAQRHFQELGEENPWWVVDVYVIGSGNQACLDEELVRTLRENFHKERFPTDGRIYQSIRFYQGAPGGRRNKAAENFWWAVLQSEPGSRKAGYLRTLPGPLIEAFDALLPIKGLWAGMSLGVLHKLRAMKCTEPIICYLRHIRQTFSDMVAGRPELLSQIDATTVRILQSRAPGISGQDREYLCREESRLFRHIESPQREEIRERLMRIEYPVPTLKTFFQDILYLDVGQSVMRRLCSSPLKGERTIDEVLREQYTGERFGNQIETGLCDLWRFSLRFAFELSGQKTHHRRVPRKAADIERAQLLGLNERPDEAIAPRLWPCFFGLAHRHGFCFPVDDQDTMEPEMTAPRQPDFPPEDDADLDIERRCGKPFTDTVGPDRYALSLESLLHPHTWTRVSAVYVRQRVFHAFFGYLNPLMTLAQLENPPEPPPDSADNIIFEQEPLHSAEPYSAEPYSVEPHSAEPYGIVHPSPSRPAWLADLEDPEDLDPQPPILPSRRPNFARSPPQSTLPQHTTVTHFIFEIIDGANHLPAIRLPHNRDALNKFFEKLADWQFHFQHPSETRTIPYEACYPYYIIYPFQRLRAVYCQRCSVHAEGRQRLHQAEELRQAVEQVQSAEAETLVHSW